MTCFYYQAYVNKEGELTCYCTLQYDNEEGDYYNCFCYGNELECTKGA